MKTKEFIEKVEALGYVASKDFEEIHIQNKDGIYILCIYPGDWEIDTDYPVFRKLSWEQKKALMRIVSEFLLTDPTDREEEKRYYLRLDAPLLQLDEDERYLKIDINTGVTFLSKNKVLNKNKFKTIFTETEIAEMDITGFVKEEVE